MFLVGLLLGVLFVSPCVFVYTLLIKGLDRYEPEPWWLLAVMFVWGAVVATTAAIIASLLGLGAMVWASGFDAQDPLVDAASATIIAPITEEGTKALGLFILWAASALWLKEVDGPLDGAIYGGVVGLGFTLTEDILYVASAMAEGGPEQFAVLFVIRTILAGLGHASFTALTGLGIGIAIESRHPAVKVFAPLLGFLGAVALHALHNGLVTFLMAGGLGFLVKLLVFWVIDSLYFVLLVALVVRDRRIVIEGLRVEVGRLIHAFELHRTSSYWMFLPLWNYFSLADSQGGYWAARAKQLALIELAFLRRRVQWGEQGMEKKEQRLLWEIAQANGRGVVIGRPSA